MCVCIHIHVIFVVVFKVIRSELEIGTASKKDAEVF